MHDQIKAAPSANRQFHASDLCCLIGQAAYDARVLEVDALLEHFRAEANYRAAVAADAPDPIKRDLK
jgi:hypothetical protein